jgi:hypothetical protein
MGGDGRDASKNGGPGRTFFAPAKMRAAVFRATFPARFFRPKKAFGGESGCPKERQFFCSTKFHRVVTISLARP